LVTGTYEQSVADRYALPGRVAAKLLHTQKKGKMSTRRV
jgi:hypothetical protein